MVESLLEQFTYLAVFALLVAGGVGVPVPEELIQLTTGYLARRGVVEFMPAVVVAWMGLVLGDSFLFRIARRQGPKVLNSPKVGRLLTPERRASIERHFSKHAFLTIVAARHMSALRLPIFAMAGVSGVPLRTFVLADALSAMASVPLVLGLGWYFAEHISDIRRDIRWIEHGIAVIAILAGVAYVVWQRRKAKRAVTIPQPPPAGQGPPSMPSSANHPL